MNENWKLLSSMEKRQFLLQFVEKITFDIQKEEKAYFGSAKIVDVVFK